MRTWIVIGIGLLALAMPAAPALQAGGSEGPFTGRVVQGETDAHAYDNNPRGDPCIDVMATYTVVLRYTPTTDTLELRAGGQTGVGTGGGAFVSFWAPYCTAFTIEVEGVSVATAADYVVTVERSVGEIA